MNCASTSGRACSVENTFLRSDVRVQLQQSTFKPVQAVRKQRALVCSAVAGRQLGSPVFRALFQLFRVPQETSSTEMLADQSPVPFGECRDQSQGPRLGQVIKQCTSAAVMVGLKLTGLALQLARRVVEDARRVMRLSAMQRELQAEAQAAAAALAAKADQEWNQAVYREKLRQQGADPAFMKMLHSLDKCNMNFEEKWGEVQRQIAGKADFSLRLQQLFDAAGKSANDVQTLLAPTATRAEVNSFWKSPETAALIAEEDALKQLVFAQVLQASAS